MKKYLIIIEETGAGYSAFSPDLPGCFSTGWTRPDVEQNMRKVIAHHLQSLRSDGEILPEPHTYSSYVEISV
jgi:predicted RNase H-like HicB family nuclease